MVIVTEEHSLAITPPRLLLAVSKRLPSDYVACSPAYTEASRRTAQLARLGSAVLADLTVTVIGLSAMSVVGLTTFTRTRWLRLCDHPGSGMGWRFTFLARITRGYAAAAGRSSAEQASAST